ncbi:unnamed protein product [Protopolystoma xenopodis]|uniref:Uncharacterized protein n=1 Tax=Protopolystoma xenopodis TaxID=117903 RepID=A0A448XGG2_9PLAT|nr:unnamed protein product [Protopolystoma xenopodis]
MSLSELLLEVRSSGLAQADLLLDVISQREQPSAPDSEPSYRGLLLSGVNLASPRFLAVLTRGIPGSYPHFLVDAIWPSAIIGLAHTCHSEFGQFPSAGATLDSAARGNTRSMDDRALPPRYLLGPQDALPSMGTEINSNAADTRDPIYLLGPELGDGQDVGYDGMEEEEDDKEESLEDDSSEVERAEGNFATGKSERDEDYVTANLLVTGDSEELLDDLNPPEVDEASASASATEGDFFVHLASSTPITYALGLSHPATSRFQPSEPVGIHQAIHGNRHQHYHNVQHPHHHRTSMPAQNRQHHPGTQVPQISLTSRQASNASLLALSETASLPCNGSRCVIGIDNNFRAGQSSKVDGLSMHTDSYQGKLALLALYHVSLILDIIPFSVFMTDFYL